MGRRVTEGLAAAGLLFLGAAVPAAAEQGGSPGMDELTASIEAESGDPVDARTWQAEYEDRIRRQNERLDEHDERLKALEAQVKDGGTN